MRFLILILLVASISKAIAVEPPPAGTLPQGIWFTVNHSSASGGTGDLFDIAVNNKDAARKVRMWWKKFGDANWQVKVFLLPGGNAVQPGKFNEFLGLYNFSDGFDVRIALEP